MNIDLTFDEYLTLKDELKSRIALLTKLHENKHEPHWDKRIEEMQSVLAKLEQANNPEVKVYGKLRAD